MPTTTDVRVNDLIINKMTQEQYDALQDKSPTELYVVEGDSNVIYAEQAVELPTASESNLGRIYQYIGITNQNYINGYFYKCTATGDPVVYSWTQIDVQPQASGLPDQTDQSGKFLTTDGTDASWSNQLDGNLDIISNSGLRVKRIDNSSVFHLYLTAGVQKAETEFRVGQGSSFNPWSTSANFILGYDGSSSSARTSTFYAAGNSVDIKNLGGLNNKWTSVYVTKINNGADITVPTTGGTMAVINTPATMPQLVVDGWSSNTQTVNVTGVTANNVVMVSPSPVSATEYAQCGILCTAQAAGTLTFTCTSVPTNDLTVNVVCF